MKLFSIPHDIRLDIKDFLVPSDIENILDTGRGLWQQIFKDPTWIDTAVKSGQSSPVLIGHNLSSFRSRKSSNCLYLSLVVNDISGDLRDTSQTFFSTLQNGWRYDKEKFEVYFSSGITLNIYDIINGDETIKLPLERIFTNKTKGIYTEYCYYKDLSIRELQPSNIIKWDPSYRTTPHAPLGWWNGPSSKGRDIRMGCKLTLLDGDTETVYIILPTRLKRKLWAKIT
ncbi:uncharacterized protein BO88DRAFT_379127 [Aspergillus vadensis CBS 113365]|uniref:Uncharacterized protein n=1 Tax=Aspergillus vadensis (strain CBS 113365 / IMI 142717 / IBT 24658) TaxID=1448311 RepID=A0A319D599_ASPVC|nr:hypothetical protein BO88DRAFT_379127 [Aspergillus vadensis CBS 113365]PYH75172.1 hypothetical protein BO88DRAFT_379127 [Aspergillus vadensis CBS 113365]